MNTSARTIPLAFTQPVRDVHRWALAGLMLTVVGLGWKYPVLGFVVPVAMAAGMVGSFFRGRYVCGNLCPRGSFFDTLFRLVGGSRPIPEIVRNPIFRWTVLAGLMGFMAFQISLNPTDALHWGKVFWFACAATTGVGVILGLVYRSRTWCTLCPVGTMAAAIGGDKKSLRIGSDCRQCKLCERSCSMDLTIAEHKPEGVLPHRDCLRCSACVSACPRKALSWPEAA